MNNNAKKFLGRILRDDDPKSLTLVLKDLSATLGFTNGQLTDFMISQSFNIEIHGDDDAIEIVYPHNGRAIRISVEADAEEIDKLLAYFNEKVVQKYKEKIESKTLNESEAKEIVSSLLDYIDTLTDSRAHDMILKLKGLLKNETLEFEIHDVVEVFGDDDIPDEEG